MATLGATTVTSITCSTNASLANHLTRRDDVQALITAEGTHSHTHSGVDISDLEAKVTEYAYAVRENSNSVTWVNTSGTLQAGVNLKTDGGLACDSGGVSVSFGSTATTAAAGNHTHSDLHTAATVSGTQTVDLSINGQEIQASVRLSPTGGLQSGTDGISVDTAYFTQSGVAHNPVTVANTSSVSLSLTDQLLSASVSIATPTLGSPYAKLADTGSGLAAYVGTSGVAAYSHTHSEATSSAAGFISAANQRKLDNYGELSQLEVPYPFTRPDYLVEGEYVGGKMRFGQDMQLTGYDVIARAPSASNVSLAVETNGTIVQRGLLLPTGTPNTEVALSGTFTNQFITSGQYLRVLCESGVSSAAEIENAPSMVTVCINARPSVGNVPEIQLNCGGTAESPYSEDDYYDSGSTNSTTTTIDISGATDPAPTAVYQSCRYYYSRSTPLVYSITGLGKGIAYRVRLHFAELYWTVIGQQIMDLEVTGTTTQTESNYDVLSETSSTQFKAVIKEFSDVYADTNGMITVKITPVAPNFNYAINAIEIVE